MKQYLLLVLLALLVACTPQAPMMTEKNTLAVNEPAMMEKSSAPESTMTKDESSMMQKEESAMMKDDSTMMEKETMMKDDSAMVEKNATDSVKLVGGDISQYRLWDTALFDKANKEGKLIYLEFSANWCPVCKQQERDLITAFDSLDNPKVIGFKIPYKDSETTDEHTALARKYGIAYQHTKVILLDGKVALKSPQAWSADQFLTEVNKLG